MRAAKRLCVEVGLWANAVALAAARVSSLCLALCHNASAEALPQAPLAVNALKVGAAVTAQLNSPAMSRMQLREKSASASASAKSLMRTAAKFPLATAVVVTEVRLANIAQLGLQDRCAMSQLHA